MHRIKIIYIIVKQNKVFIIFSQCFLRIINFLQNNINFTAFIYYLLVFNLIFS